MSARCLPALTLPVRRGESDGAPLCVQLVGRPRGMDELAIKDSIFHDQFSDLFDLRSKDHIDPLTDEIIGTEFVTFE